MKFLLFIKQTKNVLEKCTHLFEMQWLNVWWEMYSSQFFLDRQYKYRAQSNKLTNGARRAWILLTAAKESSKWSFQIVFPLLPSPFQIFWLSLERSAAVLLNERSAMSSVISIDEASASVYKCPLALMSRRCLSLVLYMCQWQKKAQSKPPLTGWRQSARSQSRRTPFKRNDKSSQSEGGEIDLDTHCSKEERLRLSGLFLLFEVG